MSRLTKITDVVLDPKYQGFSTKVLVSSSEALIAYNNSDRLIYIDRTRIAWYRYEIEHHQMVHLMESLCHV